MFVHLYLHHYLHILHLPPSSWNITDAKDRDTLDSSEELNVGPCSQCMLNMGVLFFKKFRTTDSLTYIECEWINLKQRFWSLPVLHGVSGESWCLHPPSCRWPPGLYDCTVAVRQCRAHLQKQWQSLLCNLMKDRRWIYSLPPWSLHGIN